MKLNYNTNNRYLSREYKKMKRTIYRNIVSVCECGYIDDENERLMHSLAPMKDILWEVSEYI